jgi:hypothetical protein
MMMLPSPAVATDAGCAEDGAGLVTNTRNVLGLIETTPDRAKHPVMVVPSHPAPPTVGTCKPGVQAADIEYPVPVHPTQPGLVAGCPM